MGGWIVSLSLGLAGVAVLPLASHAEGHGPAFGLATPTLARGQWSSDTVVMSLAGEMGNSHMLREMVGYGITEDLQVNLAFPIARSGETMTVPRTRVGSMMGAFQDVEASLQWRFHRTAPRVGTRRESTLFAGISDTGDAERGGVNVGMGIHVAAVTGYASRTTYWWIGAGAQGYSTEGGERLGNLYYATAVFGWRPPLFRQDYPKPDWRLFVESLYEKTEPNRAGGQRLLNSGGQKVLVGPSVLGLYGRWGIEGGLLWLVSQSLDGSQPEERYRAKLVFTYWF